MPIISVIGRGEEDQFEVRSQLCSELGVRLGLKKSKGRK